MSAGKYYVYVLQNSSHQLYIGHTSDLQARLLHHQNGDSTWTRSRGPWELVYQEEFSTRADAMKRERQLKVGRENQRLRSKIQDSRR